jgi:hypothetical protein
MYCSPVFLFRAFATDFSFLIIPVEYR